MLKEIFTCTVLVASPLADAFFYSKLIFLVQEVTPVEVMTIPM